MRYKTDHLFVNFAIFFVRSTLFLTDLYNFKEQAGFQLTATFPTYCGKQGREPLHRMPSDCSFLALHVPDASGGRMVPKGAYSNNKYVFTDRLALLKVLVLEQQEKKKITRKSSSSIASLG